MIDAARENTILLQVCDTWEGVATFMQQEQGRLSQDQTSSGGPQASEADSEVEDAFKASQVGQILDDLSSTIAQLAIKLAMAELALSDAKRQNSTTHIMEARTAKARCCFVEAFHLDEGG
jgi:hypothetical protein